MDGGGLIAGFDGGTLRIPAGGRATIGRTESCAIRFDDERVSRTHAELWATPDGWRFADRDSSGGSWVDDRRISEALITGRVHVRLADPHDGPELILEPEPAAPADRAFGEPAIPASRAPGEPTVEPADEPLEDDAAPGADAARAAPIPTGAFRHVHAASAVVRIGRAEDNDVVVDDLMVSRYHAELRSTSGGGSEIVDLGSLNGTYVNGVAVTRAVLAEFDLVSIGRNEFRLMSGGLEEYVDTGDVTLEAVGLTVTGREGKTLVDDVSFVLPGRSLMAVVGPSGAGKSMLLGALSGLRPAPVGSVSYGGRDLYTEYAELRHRIGLVPQEDVLHHELGLRRALEYSGRLRFPTDVSAVTRGERVDEVLAELGIAHRATSPIHQLSGGERKRTNVALELLTKPSLLLLDEPVSGLDPGLGRVLMRLLRELADDGRTIIVVTHEISSLSVCDQVLVIAPGGVPAYVGPPAEAPGRFGETDMAEVFTDLVSVEPTSWHIGRTTDAVAATSATIPPGASPGPDGDAAPATVSPVVPAARQGWWSQLRTLTSRYVEVLAADRRNAALLLLQAPVLGVLILAALPTGELGAPAETEVRLVSAAGIALFVVLVGATWLGANNAIREIARELPMIRRERTAGLSLSAYVASKAIVLGALTTVQAVVLVALATARQGGPGDAVLLGWGTGELMVVVSLAGVASMALALLISAVAGSAERATSVLPVVLILQLVLAAGVVLPEIVDKPVLNQLSLASSTQWGIAGAASTVDLNGLQVFDDRLRDLRSIDANNPDRAVDALASQPEPSGRWAHTARAWLTAVLALLMLTALPLVLCARALRRFDPGRT